MPPLSVLPIKKRRVCGDTVLGIECEQHVTSGSEGGIQLTSQTTTVPGAHFTRAWIS
jgi:hypothetical protein